MATKTSIIKPSDQITSKMQLTRTEAVHYLTEWTNRLPDNAIITGHQNLQGAVDLPVPYVEVLSSKLDAAMQVLASKLTEEELASFNDKLRSLD